MKYMIYDTETTGLVPRNVSYKDILAFERSRIVEIAWIVVEVVDGVHRIVRVQSEIMTPQGYTSIPEVCTRIHGINFESAERNGVDPSEVLCKFSKDIEKVDLAICHNVAFDKPLVSSELFRFGYLEESGRVASKPHLCTMLEGKKYLGCSKFPKLSELYEFMFKCKPTQLHHALSDVLICYECYKKLIAEGLPLTS